MMENMYLTDLQKKDINSREEALTYLADRLYTNGDVKGSFKEAIIDRENHFATGLALNQLGVAIPHTDNIHVNHSKIAVMTLQEPVEFYQMGSTTETVSVSMIFMLALKDAHGHLDMLQKLMTFFQDQEALKALLDLEDSDEGHAAAAQLLQEHQIMI